MYANLEVVKGLNLRTTYGLNNISFEDKSFYTALAGDGYSTGGSASNYYRTNKRWNWQNTLQYDHTFGEKHNLSLLVGNEQQATDVHALGRHPYLGGRPVLHHLPGQLHQHCRCGQLPGRTTTWCRFLAASTTTLTASTWPR